LHVALGGLSGAIGLVDESPVCALLVGEAGANKHGKYQRRIFELAPRYVLLYAEFHQLHDHDCQNSAASSVPSIRSLRNDLSHRRDTNTLEAPCIGDRPARGQRQGCEQFAR